MPFTSWLPFSSASRPETTATDKTISGSDKNYLTSEVSDDAAIFSIDDIVNQFNELTKEVSKLQKLSTDQQAKIKDYLQQLKDARSQRQQQDNAHRARVIELRNSVNNERNVANALQGVIAGQQSIKDLRLKGQVQPFTRIVRAERDESSRQQAQLASLQTKFTKANQDIASLRKQLNEMNLKNGELTLDVEYLKCTAASEPPSKTDLEVIESDAHTAGSPIRPRPD